MAEKSVWLKVKHATGGRTLAAGQGHDPGAGGDLAAGAGVAAIADLEAAPALQSKRPVPVLQLSGAGLVHQQRNLVPILQLKEVALTPLLRKVSLGLLRKAALVLQLNGAIHVHQ